MTQIALAAPVIEGFAGLCLRLAALLALVGAPLTL